MMTSVVDNGNSPDRLMSPVQIGNLVLIVDKLTGGLNRMHYGCLIQSSRCHLVKRSLSPWQSY